MSSEDAKVEEQDMTGWSEEDIKRYNEFVEGFISACKEIKAMRDGLIPEPEIGGLEMLYKLEREAQEEERLEREAELAKQAKRVARA